MNKYYNYLISIAIVVSFTALLGCGGSSNNAAIDDENISWTQGVFEDENLFKSACATPRSGTDINGNTFPDIQGSTLNENHWLRSWSNNTYLWYSEINDQNPASFSSTDEYFDVLKTEELTNSGNPRDRFHFTFDSEDWLQLTQAGQSAGYGAEWAVIASSPPRQILIAYTEPNTPATEANVNLQRGAEIITIDGAAVVDSSDTDTLNAGLSPAEVGESHTFVIRDLGATETREITMTSAIITSPPVLNTSTIQTSSGNVGYILFNSHVATAEQALVNAINQLSSDNVNELVLDLRYNGGGLLAISSQLAYMIAGSNTTTDKIFDNIIFNDKHTVTNPVTGQTLTPTPFYNQTLGFSIDEGQALPSLNLDRVFILSTGGTCSASEAIINGLRGVNVEVVLIGSTTCGKPYGFYAADNCGTTYFTIQFKGENELGFGDYTDGFSPINTAGTVGTTVPGCSVADDYNHQLGDEQEDLLATALAYRDTGICPTPTGQAIKMTADNLKQDGISQNDQGLAIKDPKKLRDMILGLPSGRR